MDNRSFREKSFSEYTEKDMKDYERHLDRAIQNAPHPNTWKSSDELRRIELQKSGIAWIE